MADALTFGIESQGTSVRAMGDLAAPPRRPGSTPPGRRSCTTARRRSRSPRWRTGPSAAGRHRDRLRRRPQPADPRRRGPRPRRDLPTAARPRDRQRHPPDDLRLARPGPGGAGEADRGAGAAAARPLAPARGADRPRGPLLPPADEADRREAPLPRAIPIWTAGVNPRMIESAGRVADGLSATPSSPPSTSPTWCCRRSRWRRPCRPRPGRDRGRLAGDLGGRRRRRAGAPRGRRPDRLLLLGKDLRGVLESSASAPREPIREAFAPPATGRRWSPPSPRRWSTHARRRDRGGSPRRRAATRAPRPPDPLRAELRHQRRARVENANRAGRDLRGGHGERRRRVIELERFGGPEVMRWVERPPPDPGPDEVVVEVEALGVNFGDTMVRRGEYRRDQPLDFTPGFEAAGRIVDTASGEPRGRPPRRSSSTTTAAATPTRSSAPRRPRLRGPRGRRPEPARGALHPGHHRLVRAAPLRRRRARASGR